MSKLLWRRLQSVRDLGVYIDSRLSKHSFVQGTVLRSLAVLRQLHTIRRQIPLLRSSFLDWTIVTTFCLDFLPTSSRASSLFRTLLHGGSSESDDQSILLPRSSAFTGWASQSAFPSNWLSWRTDRSTALHLVNYSRVSPASPTWHQDDGCNLLPPVPLSRSTARSTLYSQQTGVPSCRGQHVERPSVAPHICTVTRGFRQCLKTFLFLFLPGHADMTNFYYLLLSLVFFVWHFLRSF